MWLPLLLLALMASGSACPDLCECHQTNVPRVDMERDSPALLEVTCRGRVPGPSEIPRETKGLTFDGMEEYEVTGLLEELETSEFLEDITLQTAVTLTNEEVESRESNETLREDDRKTDKDKDNYNDDSDSDTLYDAHLPYLEELTVTNCSLVSLNVTWRGLGRVRTLNLSCNSLTTLADALPSRTNLTELTCLDLSDNSLTDLSAGIFRTLGLLKLTLRRNAIAAVHEDAFRGLDRLEFLDLSDNRLADLPDSALTPLYALQKLDLSGNQLQVLGARWFESLDRLRELDVSRNGLARAASGTLQPLSGLSILRLAENPLKERDVSLLLGTGRRLETVDASRTGLARVPAALTRSVRALRLAGNKLTTIRGGDLDSYPLLRMLDISDNRLTDIEDDALGRLEVLEELNISGNALKKVPGSLPNSLTVLNLERNSIISLKLDDLQGLYNLRSLSLNDNDIEEIQVGALGQLPVLVELNLSDNPVKALPANTLSGPSNLATLRMSGLTALQRSGEQERQTTGDMAFPVPTPERLAVLDVSRSPLLAEELLADDAALSACKSLLELNLSETNVTTLRSDLPYMLPQLRTMILSGNEWNCTEDLYWLGEWMRQHRKTNEDEPGYCFSPKELADLSLYELPSPSPPIISSVTKNENISYESTNAESNVDYHPNLQETSTGYSVNVVLTDFTTGNAEPVYEAPTSFRNITLPILPSKNDDLESKLDDSMKGIQREDISMNSIEDDSVGHSKKQQDTVLANKLVSNGPSATKVQGEKLRKHLNQQGKENPLLAEADSSTMAEELNGKATDSGARVSAEALSAGAHPGMLVLAGAALGAAAALTVVLSRRATVRRRDRYHRHENIEVHTLTTPTAELW